MCIRDSNRYTVVKGDSIHWLLQQSDKRNKYLSYLILKGEYREVQNLAKWEYTNKKLEVLASDRIFSGYFNDYFNFVDEVEYQKLSSDRLIGDYLNDANLLGEYKIKVYRDNGINFFDLDIVGKIELKQDKRTRNRGELDLHIEKLGVDYKGKSNGEIVQIQLDAASNFIDKSMLAGKRELILVHGVGNGTLKKEVHKLLKSYYGIRFEQGDSRKYGDGATLVHLKG